MIMYWSSILGIKRTGIQWVSTDKSMYPVQVIEQNCLRSFALKPSVFIKQKQEAESKMDTKSISTNTLTKN